MGELVGSGRPAALGFRVGLKGWPPFRPPGGLSGWHHRPPTPHQAHGQVRSLCCGRENATEPYHHAYHVLGLIGTALSKQISVFQSSALKAAPMSPDAWQMGYSKEEVGAIGNLGLA
jgi:hypothetical protein